MVDLSIQYRPVITPPLTPLPTLTMVYIVPTKPRNRNPYLNLEEKTIEVITGYNIPLKLQLWLPHEPTYPLDPPASLYAKLILVDSNKDVTAEYLSF